MNRSLRRLGQLLVVMGALLGATIGVALALIVENAENSRAVVASGRERAAVFQAAPAVWHALMGNVAEARRTAGLALDMSAGRDVSYAAAFALALTAVDETAGARTPTS